MEQPDLHIPFRLELGEAFDEFERMAFWDSASTVQWFRERGYTLYERQFYEGMPTYHTIPALPSADFVEADYPYAYHNVQPVPLSMRTSVSTGKVLFAQDSQQRHVAIKLVRDNSEEYRILRFLSQQSMETLKENCIIHVLDFLPAQGFWLVVMPRWGSAIHLPKGRTMHDILQIMYSMLKALTFLHEHNVTHRDMNLGNVLVNHFSDHLSLHQNDVRSDLRSKGLLLYAVFDFDISIMVPPQVLKEEYRLPYQLSWWGTFNQPHDTAQGEFDYNPFSYDVGMLGVEFCNRFQHFAREIPMLAPLLDRMTTRDLRRRFTAAEALQFFEDMRSQLTDVQLETFEYPPHYEDFKYYDEYDRWQHVPPDFAAKWAAYREPPLPFTIKVIRTITLSEWFPPYVVPWIRWTFFKLTSFPWHIWTRFWGHKAL
ncbi:kinase-like domain-containing protein [Flammula alnicola]|nr:kinase-like domain-containing protein [Flammula alnicola]